MKAFLAWATLGAIGLAGASLAAHHAAALYQQDVLVTLEGTVEEIRFADPHTLLQVTGPDGSYVVEWEAASVLAEAGITDRTVRARNYLVITGSPSINPRAKRMALLREVLRPEDGWIWQAEGAAPPAAPAP